MLVNRDWLMCRLCWPQLPAEIRRQIANNYRPGRRHQSIRYHAAVRQAIDMLALNRRRAS